MVAVKKNKKVAINNKKTLENSIVDLFVVMVFCLFPLVVDNKYFNILPTKYYFYVGAVVLLAIPLLVVGLLDQKKIVRYIQGFSWRGFCKTKSVTDWALILFVLVAAVSTCISEYVSESFWGNEGRLTGLFLLSLYAVVYFCVTRFGKMKRWHLDILLIFGMLVCIFGITDYFDLDILKFKINISPEQYYMFTSTIGNINSYTVLVAMYTAVSAVLYATEKNIKKQIFYYLCTVVSLFAVIMGISDNAILSLGALYALLPFYLFGSDNGVRKYLVLLAGFFTVLKCISWINLLMGDQLYGIKSTFNILIEFNGLIWIVLGLWLIIGFWYLFMYMKKKETCIIKGKGLRYLWFGFLATIFIAVLYLFYDVNINGNIDKYGMLNNYLLFSDSWGTNRGYIWRNAIECFMEFPPIKKIFGYGPETFGIVLLEKTRSNMYRETYDAAHNEYLQYLITVGVAGLTAYMVHLISFIRYGIKNISKSPYIVACLFAVVCYSVQAFVNISIPIASPIMFLLLALGVMGCRENEHERI